MDASGSSIGFSAAVELRVSGKGGAKTRSDVLITLFTAVVF